MVLRMVSDLQHSVSVSEVGIARTWRSHHFASIRTGLDVNDNGLLFTDYSFMNFMSNSSLAGCAARALLNAFI